MGRRILAIFAAAVIALVGVVSVMLYARGADARAVSANQPTAVFVSTKAIPAATQLKDAVRTGLLVKTVVPAKAVPLGALSDVNADNSSLVAVTDIAPGEYVLASRFSTQPQGIKAIEVPAGKVAVSIQLSDPARVGSFVTPGSHIAIFDSTVVPNTGGTKGTALLLDDVLVIGMGNAALNPGNQAAGQPPAASGGFLVTLAVTPVDAARIIQAQGTGALYAVLRSSDLKMANTPVVGDKNLFNGVGAGQ